MRLTKRQLKRIIREEYSRISESNPPGWGYQGNTGLGSEEERPEPRSQFENVSGSFGELIGQATEVLHGGQDSEGAFNTLWNEPEVTGFIEQALQERGVDFSDEDISYLVQSLVDVATMLVDGAYTMSQAHKEFSDEFDAIQSGGWEQ